MGGFESAACGKYALPGCGSRAAASASGDRMQTAKRGVRNIQNSSNYLTFPRSNYRKWALRGAGKSLAALDLNVQPTGIPGVMELMAVIRKRSLLSRIAAGLISLLAVAVVCGPASAQTAVQSAHKAPPNELLQYIRNAKQQGLTEARIRQQARAIGWSAAAVDEAMAFEATTAKAPEGTTKATETTNPDAAREETLRGQPSPAGTAPDDYQIGAGDTLQISVWKEPDVSVPSVVVRPDGRITVPLIKEVAVAGLTPREAERVITESLSKFITDANVTVVVAAINSKKIYVIGAVRKEGPLPYTSGLTVMQALSEAGGLTDYAKRKRMYVLRTENGREYRLDFNYDEAVKGERMEQNIFLLPGDTVIIPH